MTTFLPAQRARIYCSWRKNHINVTYYGNLLSALATAGMKDKRILDFMNGGEHLMISNGLRIVKNTEYVEITFLNNFQPSVNVVPNRERRLADQAFLRQLAQQAAPASDSYDI